MDKHRLDRIYIRDLQLSCIIGIYPKERTTRQEVIINIVLFADLRRAGVSDRIEDTLDYKLLKKSIMAAVEASEFLLIERLAESIAAMCLGHPLVQRVCVSVDKPGALRFARSVAVEIERERDGAT